MNKKILKRVRDLVERGWIVTERACDENGKSCSPKSKRARSFCLLGAIDRATNKYRKEVVKHVAGELKKQLPMRRRCYDEVVITTWNDAICRTKKEVLKLLDDMMNDKNG